MGTQHDPHSNDPSLQGQGQGQGQLEGQLQGELQGQGQGQLQGQGELQGQGQGQSQSETSLNGNGNGNGNLNLDGNGNLNGNGNFNGNENSNCDSASSSAQSAANVCDNVNVNVNVDVAACIGPPSETGVLNMDNLSLCNTGGSFVVMPDLGTQTLNGDGNIFHLDQVNDLVSNGTVSCLTDGLSIGAMSGGDGGLGASSGDPCYLPTEYGGNGGGSSFSFAQTGSSTGGTANLGDAGTAGTTGGAVTQEAFTQHVILGSNIQFNSLPITIVGHDSITAGHDASHA